MPGLDVAQEEIIPMESNSNRRETAASRKVMKRDRRALRAATLRAEGGSERVVAECLAGRLSRQALTEEEYRMLRVAQEASRGPEKKPGQRAASGVWGSVPYGSEPFGTIRAAWAAGFVEAREWHYGGEQLIVKGHVLVRGAREALSRTTWEGLGFRVKPDAAPHTTRWSQVGSGAKTVAYPLFRADQVEATRCRGAGRHSASEKAAILSPDVPRWNDGTVRRIAQGIRYEDAAGKWRILHDALLDAGCGDEIILAHCLFAGPHPDTCWLIEMLLR
jgi:hypothetical protein